MELDSLSGRGRDTIIGCSSDSPLKGGGPHTRASKNCKKAKGHPSKSSKAKGHPSKSSTSKSIKTKSKMSKSNMERDCSQSRLVRIDKKCKKFKVNDKGIMRKKCKNDACSHLGWLRKKFNHDPPASTEPLATDPPSTIPPAIDPTPTTIANIIANFTGDDAQDADEAYQDLLQFGADAIEPLLEVAQSTSPLCDELYASRPFFDDRSSIIRSRPSLPPPVGLMALYAIDTILFDTLTPHLAPILRMQGGSSSDEDPSLVECKALLEAVRVYEQW